MGPEVVAEAVAAGIALREASLVDLDFVELDWGAERFLREGTAVPEGGFELLRACDAILFGALGDPRVSDHEHARRILLGIRRHLDLYLNLRPVRCLAERLNPLRRTPCAAIDLCIVRENTEGLYCGAGGALHEGTADEVALEDMVVTRRGVERVIRAAFELAQRRPRRAVTLVDKSNALRHVGALWQRTFGDVAREFPAVSADHLYVDTAAMWLVLDPGRFDVVVTGNLFGDILSDLAAALQGGLGMAPSANLHPGRASMFEPVHGSAPELAGTGKANPLAALASFGMLLGHAGRPELEAAMARSVAAAVDSGALTPDVGGTATTAEVGATVRARLLEFARA
ncbi:MAG: isocitrate/isopropylmalate dehydrogenase family protein [Acidobacteriota bacterium]